MRLIRAISYFFKARPWSTSRLVVLVLIAAFAEGLGIGFLVPLLETIDEQGASAAPSQVSEYLSGFYEQIGVSFTLTTIMVGAFLLFVIQALLTYLAETQTIRLATQFNAEVRTRMFSGLLNADLAYHHKRKGGDFVNSLINECNRFQGVFLHSMRLLTSVIEAAVYLALAIYLSWQLVLAAGVLVGGVVFVVKSEFTRANRYGSDLTDANKSLSATAIERLSGIRILKAFNLEGLSLNMFKANAFELKRVYYAMAKSQARLDGLFRLGMLGGLLLSVYVAITFLELSVPVLMAFVFILYRFYPRVGGINKAFHQLTFGISGVDNVMKLIEETESPSIRNGTKLPSPLQHEIGFEGLVFGYDPEVPVLNDVSFVLKAGETTAVVGGSGAGKTTIVNLLMRFHDPSFGSVLVDGIDLREMDLHAWRSSIALVNQDIFLFNDTISNNIAKGKLGATDQEIVEASRQAYADEFIRELPDGYETVIGDRGVRLSGGQRQRIALARAIVRDPQILILDEATSELDSMSEQLIRQAVEELGTTRTVITVAHRLSTIRHADKIIVLDQGKLVEEGSHDELLSGNGHYAQFVRLQGREREPQIEITTKDRPDLS